MRLHLKDVLASHYYLTLATLNRAKSWKNSVLQDPLTIVFTSQVQDVLGDGLGAWVNWSQIIFYCATEVEDSMYSTVSEYGAVRRGPDTSSLQCYRTALL